MHHHYLTIEQRNTLEKLVRSSMGVGARLDAALGQLHQPDYGVCIDCRQDIAFELLLVNQLAVHCRSCMRLPVARESTFVCISRAYDDFRSLELAG